MVDAMGFRPLDEIPEPSRRADVHVLEVAIEGRDVAGQRRGYRIEPEHQRRNERGDQEKHDRLQWMKQRRTRHVHALRTVMDLVEQPPHWRKRVRAAVPNVTD